MPLIVVHGHDRVEVAVARLDEQRVGRQRAGHVEARGASLLDGRRNDPPLFVAKKPLLAGVRV